MPDIPGRKKTGGYISPDPGDLPEHGKKILSAAYSSCRAAWVKEHPDDRENKANKTSCARQAWGAVRKAGFKIEDGYRLEAYLEQYEPRQSATPPENIHGRGQDERSNTKKVFDNVPASSQVPGGGGISTPSFIKVPKKSNFELDPLWKQTKDVMGVEIFSTGTWKGREWTDADLTDAVQNFRAGVLGAEPYITIDHEPEATDEFSKALDGMALGFVSNLYKAGKKLIADFTKVPRVIAELMMAGPLKNKSIELWPEFEAQDGTVYRNVLEAVTLTGKIPAVAGLSDVVALFKRGTGIAQNSGRRKIKLTTGGHKMSEITIEQTEYNGLLKFKVEREVMEDQVVKFKAEIVDFKKQIEAKDSKITELEKFKADAQKSDQERENTKAVKFAEKLITMKKIIPAKKDYYIEQYKMNKAKSPEMFKAFLEEVKGKANEVITGELGSSGSGKGLPVDSKHVRENFKKTAGTQGSAYDAAHKAITAYMEKNGLTGPDGYQKAMKHLKLMESPIEAEAEARQKMEEEEAKIKAEEEETNKDGKDGEEPDADDKGSMEEENLDEEEE